MRFSKLYLIPIGFIILAIVASIVSFLQNDRLEEGYLHSDNAIETTRDGGTYFSVLGNVKNATHITTSSTDNGIALFFYDENALLLESYLYQIYPTDSSYSSDIVDMTPVSMVEIDSLDEYLFTVELTENTPYSIHLTPVDGNPSDPIDVVLVTLDGTAYLWKQTMESVVYTSVILSVTSVVIVFVIERVKDKQ